MAFTKAKEVSESYEALEVSFDKTTAGAVNKQFAATDVQAAIVEAKPVAATATVAGIVRNATDAEVNAGSNVNAYAKPNQLRTSMVNYVVGYINQNVIPLIPGPQAVPTAVYGGANSAEAMMATFWALPVGSLVVFEEPFQEAYGYGNGTAYRTAYRRRTLARTSNGGWLMVIQ